MTPPHGPSRPIVLQNSSGRPKSRCLCTSLLFQTHLRKKKQIKVTSFKFALYSSNLFLVLLAAFSILGALLITKGQYDRTNGIHTLPVLPIWGIVSKKDQHLLTALTYHIHIKIHLRSLNIGKTMYTHCKLFYKKCLLPLWCNVAWSFKNKTKPPYVTLFRKAVLNIGSLGTGGYFLLVGARAAFSTSDLPEVAPESHRCRALSHFWDPLENGN